MKDVFFLVLGSHQKMNMHVGELASMRSKQLHDGMPWTWSGIGSKNERKAKGIDLS